MDDREILETEGVLQGKKWLRQAKKPNLDTKSNIMFIFQS